MNENKAPVRLFDPQSIAIATFLGSPFMGGLLWAINESRVGRGGRSAIAIVVGLGLTALLMGLGFFDIPQSVSLGLTIGATVGARTAAQQWDAQIRGEGLVGEITYVSRWVAAGAGMFGCVSVLALVFLVVGVDPVEGEACEGDVGACAGEYDALFCEDGTFQRVSCPGGCVQSADRIECMP